MRTATAWVLTGTGVDELSGSIASGRGNTLVVTSEVSDKAGAGGRYWAISGERDRVASRQ